MAATLWMSFFSGGVPSGGVSCRTDVGAQVHTAARDLEGEPLRDERGEQPFHQRDPGAVAAPAHTDEDTLHRLDRKVGCKVRGTEDREDGAKGPNTPQEAGDVARTCAAEALAGAVDQHVQGEQEGLESEEEESGVHRAAGIKNMGMRFFAAGWNYVLQGAANRFITPNQRGFVKHHSIVQNIIDFEAASRRTGFPASDVQLPLLPLLDIRAAFPSMAHAWLRRVLK